MTAVEMNINKGCAACVIRSVFSKAKMLKLGQVKTSHSNTSNTIHFALGLIAPFLAGVFVWLMLNLTSEHTVWDWEMYSLSYVVFPYSARSRDVWFNEQ